MEEGRGGVGEGGGGIEHACLAKEPCLSGKRDLLTWQKRSVRVAKEGSCVYGLV